MARLETQSLEWSLEMQKLADTVKLSQSLLKS